MAQRQARKGTRTGKKRLKDRLDKSQGQARKRTRTGKKRHKDRQ